MAPGPPHWLDIQPARCLHNADLGSADDYFLDFLFFMFVLPYLLLSSSCSYFLVIVSDNISFFQLQIKRGHSTSLPRNIPGSTWILLHRNKEEESRGYKMSLQDYDEYNRQYVCMFICSRIKKDESRGYKMSR
jgi:hypothetical protein